MVQYRREAEGWDLIKAAFYNDAKRLSAMLSKKSQIGEQQFYQVFNLAAACGNTASMKVLMNSMPKFDVNRTDQTGCSALYYMALGGHREAIFFLLLHGAKPDVQELLYGNTPLHEAAVKGFSRTVEALCLSKASPNIPNKLRFTPLHLAAQSGHKQTARILLYFGADVNARNKYGDTPLHTATRYGHIGIVRILLTTRADITATNANYDTPLHIAAALGRSTIVRLLIEAQSMPRVDTDPESLCSRILSCVFGSAPARTTTTTTAAATSLTPSRQSAVLMRNLQNETPVDIARRKGRGRIAKVLKSLAKRTREAVYAEELLTASRHAKRKSVAARHPMAGSVTYAPAMSRTLPQFMGSSWHSAYQPASQPARGAERRAADLHSSPFFLPSALGSDFHQRGPNTPSLANETDPTIDYATKVVSQVDGRLSLHTPLSSQQSTLIAQARRRSIPRVMTGNYQTTQPWTLPVSAQNGSPPELLTSRQLPARHRLISGSLKQQQQFRQKTTEPDHLGLSWSDYQQTPDIRVDGVVVPATAIPRVRDLRSPFSELRQSLEAAVLNSRTMKGGSCCSAPQPEQVPQCGQPDIEAVTPSSMQNGTPTESTSLSKSGVRYGHQQASALRNELPAGAGSAFTTRRDEEPPMLRRTPPQVPTIAQGPPLAGSTGHCSAFLPTSSLPDAGFADVSEEDLTAYDEYFMRQTSVQSYPRSLGFVRQVAPRRASVESEEASSGQRPSFSTDANQPCISKTSDTKRSAALYSPASSLLRAPPTTTFGHVVADYNDHLASPRMEISHRTEFSVNDRSVTANHPVAKFGDRVTTRALVNLPDICSNGRDNPLKVAKDGLDMSAFDTVCSRGLAGNASRGHPQTSQTLPSPSITDVNRPRSLPFKFSFV